MTSRPASSDATEHLGIAAGGVFAVILTAAALVPLRDTFGNTNMALVLVVVIVAAAALGGRLAGALTSLAAALSYNFFHTQPYLSLAVADREDIATVVLLLVVGLAVGELASGRRRSSATAADRAEGAHRLEKVAAIVATGSHLDSLWPTVRDGITAELGLRSCRFEPAPYVGRLPLLRRTGTIDGPKRWTLQGFELPPEGSELLVEHDGRLLGRIVLEPTPGRGSSLEQRRVAVALADQLATGLARSATLAPLG